MCTAVRAAVTDVAFAADRIGWILSVNRNVRCSVSDDFLVAASDAVCARVHGVATRLVQSSTHSPRRVLCCNLLRVCCNDVARLLQRVVLSLQLDSYTEKRSRTLPLSRENIESTVRCRCGTDCCQLCPVAAACRAPLAFRRSHPCAHARFLAHTCSLACSAHSQPLTVALELCTCRADPRQPAVAPRL